MGLFVIGCIGCANVTITPNGGAKITSEPSYSETQHFYVWGLAPESRTVDASAACNGGQIKQMQTQHTFFNGLLGALTLGIYAPRTARVWCG